MRRRQHYGALETAVNSLKSQAGEKLSGIVLDLRNNPGGLLDQAVSVSNAFLDDAYAAQHAMRGSDRRRYGITR